MLSCWIYTPACLLARLPTCLPACLHPHVVTGGESPFVTAKRLTYVFLTLVCSPTTDLQSTYEIFEAAIAYCQPGRPYSGIGGVIQEMVDARGYSTISNFCER